MFGYMENRSCDMAIALTHDLIAQFNYNGSTVYSCSLDAAGAFDCIPHAVIFNKLNGIVPDYLWRLFYKWYTIC